MKKIVYFISICSFIYLFSPNLFSQSISIIQKIRSDPRLQAQMKNWVMAVVKEWETGEEPNAEDLDAVFKKPLAVFVTAKRLGEVRACMGTLVPHEKDLADEIRRNLNLAFRQDPRHRPVQKDDLLGMEIYISSLADPKLLSKPYQINPARDAILMKSGSKEAVALPGEAKTTRYLLAFLKAKAGIKKDENFQLYRMESESIKINMLPVF